MVLYIITGIKLCWSCEGVTQSWWVLSSEAPGLMPCHDQVESGGCWSLDPPWGTVWHGQWCLCPCRYDAQAWLNLVAAEGYSNWASTEEARSYIRCSTNCYWLFPPRYCCIPQGCFCVNSGLFLTH